MSRTGSGRGSRTGRGSARDALPTKPCASCGRTITWRRAWERDWDDVRHCSDACRRAGVSPVDRELEVAVLRLLDARAEGRTICPSEAARAVGGEDWRPLMEPARAAARRLVGAGAVEITQGGAVVDPSTTRGPVRVRRVRRPPEPERVPR